MRAASSTVWAGDAGPVTLDGVLAGLGRGRVARPAEPVQDGSKRRTTQKPVEVIMFRSKSRTEKLTEQLQDQSESLSSTAAALAEQLRERVVPAVGQATVKTKEWAKPRVEHGIEVAAPKLESAVSGLAPKVDTARDKIVDELIPRIAEAISAWAAASASARDEAISRGHGAAAVISGEAVASPRGKKRRVFMAFGLVAAMAAGATAFLRKSAPKDDPWTTPLADPYVATPNGRHSAGFVDEATATTRTESEIADADGETATSGHPDPAAAADLADGARKDGAGKAGANKDRGEQEGH
jgi:hypothetical protein